MKLYEIAEARAILDQWLDESDGELTPEIEELLNHLDGKADEKIERIGLYIRERGAQAKAVKEERDRLDAMAKREERAAESLKGYVKRQMEALGKTKVNGLLATVAIQRNSVPSVTTILEAHELWALAEARAFVRREEKVVYTLDREAILAAWKMEPANIPAVITVDLGSHVRVR